LFFSLLIPILQMTILGFGIDTNIRQIKTVVFNEDDARAAELIDRLRNSDTFRIVKYAYSDQEMNEAIISSKPRVGIKIPWDHADQLLRGNTAHVLVLIDGADS
jgi:ABC-2 type transport system permease protein